MYCIDVHNSTLAMANRNNDATWRKIEATLMGLHRMITQCESLPDNLKFDNDGPALTNNN